MVADFPSAEVKRLPSPRGAQHDQLRAAVLEATARLIASADRVQPDEFLNGFFRQMGNLPLKARRFVASTTYALLRRRARVLWQGRWCGAHEAQPHGTIDPTTSLPSVGWTPWTEATIGVFRWLVEDMQEPFDSAREILHETMTAWVTLPHETALPLDRPAIWTAVDAFKNDAAMQHCSPQERGAADASLPLEVWSRWTNRWGETTARAMGQALGRPVPLTLRANSLKASRADALKRLNAEGFLALPGTLAPDAIRLERKGRVVDSASHSEGIWEIQDEASQLVAWEMGAQPGWRVLDACAGAGGKALHLAAIMSNRGEIVVHDIDANRLKDIDNRARRLGVTCLRAWMPESETPADCSFDAVLIDAPCSGFGTLSRHPWLSWSKPWGTTIAEATTKQAQCLASYTRFVKPGGVLCYATCSIEPEETMGQLAAWARDSTRKSRLVSQRYILPHQHGTDGFFIATFIVD